MSGFGLNHSEFTADPISVSQLPRISIGDTDALPAMNHKKESAKLSTSKLLKEAMCSSGSAAKNRCLLVLIFLAAIPSSAQSPSPTVPVEIKPPDLNLVLQHLEDVGHQNPAQSRPYEVTREYKVFHGNDKQPTSEVMAQITFVPPDTKTYKITEARGNSRGEKIVREVLDQETESTRKRQDSEISRKNYDFIFLRRENFGVIPEYVLRIVPKRKEKFLLRGQIWVDANTFRIRRMEGVLAKSPSLWIKDIHLTVQFAELSGMWVPISFDSIATVRFLGQYTLAGLNIDVNDPLSTASKR